MKSITKRLLSDKILKFSVISLSALTSVPLLLILGTVIVRGWRQLRLSFFIKPAPSSLDAMLAASSGDAVPGGIANGIVGTLMMVGIAIIIAVPAGVFCGVYLSEHRKTLFASVVRFLTEILQGMPSVIIGIIVYLWIVIPMKSYSGIAGGIALAIMMLPLIVRSTEEMLNMLPVSLKESALALGSSYSAMVFKVLLPSAFGGILTGILLAVSRVIGETAPLMLTALGSTMVQWDPSRPSSAVPLLIWQFYNDANLSGMIWGASLFLLFIVLLLNVIAKKVSKKWKI